MFIDKIEFLEGNKQSWRNSQSANHAITFPVIFQFHANSNKWFVEFIVAIKSKNQFKIYAINYFTDKSLKQM